jgi:hypothetical protein
LTAFPVGHPLGIGTENSPKQREIPRPTSESYLTNSADCDPQRGNAAKLQILSTRDFDGAKRFAACTTAVMRRLKSESMYSRICYRYRYGFASHNALLTTQNLRK